MEYRRLTPHEMIIDHVDVATIGALAIFAFVTRKIGWWLISRATRAERRARRIERVMIEEQVLRMEITR
jgi:hypothetical protein